jgi:hypothetical protein
MAALFLVTLAWCFLIVVYFFLLDLININCITNSYIYKTCVTLEGIDYELPEDDTIVLKHIGV